MAPCVCGDRLAFDELHHQIGLLRLGDAAIDQPRNARMLQAGEHAALALEQLAVEIGEDGSVQ